MHAVINRLTLGTPIDDELIRKVEADLGPRMSAAPGFTDLRLVRVSEAEAIVVITFATREALDEISRTIAAPWFAEHVRPYLSGAVNRVVGEVVAAVPG